MNFIEIEALKLIADAQMADFIPNNSSHQLEIVENPIFPIKLLTIAEISPIVRGICVHTFVIERALKILNAVSKNTPLPPVHVDQPTTLLAPYKYRLYDGFHRYNLLMALGYTHLWAYVNPSSEV